MKFTSKHLSLHKSRRILKSAYKSYEKNRSQLSQEDLRQFEFMLEQLDEAVVNKKREEASLFAGKTEEFCSSHFKKGIGSYVLEMALAVVFALLIATVVRQSWFELYEIPTGSMRPTFKEQDHLTVTKTAFGINIPLATAHFYFDPKLVQRTGVVIWSGDHVPNLDSNSTFMGVFPYTKRFIKRCMGKPGDTLYFYGGKIYGFDKDGNDLLNLRNDPHISKLDHVPFTNFEGRQSYTENKGSNHIPEAIFHSFNESIGKLRFARKEIKGEIFNGTSWVEDKPAAQQKSHDTIQTYSDFWGIRNYAMARILNKQQLESLTSYTAADFSPALLYLELRHTPSLNYPAPLLSDRFGAAIKGYSTVIPLQEKHVQALMENMYTCRFVIKNGKGASYHLGAEKFHANSPSFPDTPDGTYEFYYGRAVVVGFGAITYPLPATHPLCNKDPSNIQKLFNVGIEMNTQVEPYNKNQPFFPNRYVYFRNGDLYAMGAVLMKKDDPILTSFSEKEKQKEEKSTTKAPYVAFKDYGPPLNKDGSLNKDFLKIFGYKVPDGRYLMLGDNHAMSQDSRYFGPIPQANLQGAPSLIIWPPGERFGFPNQEPYPLINLPRAIVWSIVALITIIWFIITRRNHKKRIFKKLP